MSVLLYTHAFLWWITLWWIIGSPNLSKQARKIIADEGNVIFVSAASAWEIAAMVRLEKIVWRA